MEALAVTIVPEFGSMMLPIGVMAATWEYHVLAVSRYQRYAHTVHYGYDVIVCDLGFDRGNVKQLYHPLCLNRRSIFFG